jgi:hypothetical protein
MVIAYEYIARLLKTTYAVVAIEMSATATDNSAASASNSSVTDIPPVSNTAPGESDNV